MTTVWSILEWTSRNLLSLFARGLVALCLFLFAQWLSGTEFAVIATMAYLLVAGT